MEDDIHLLFEAMLGQMYPPGQDPRSTVAVLMTETIRFRDKLKTETGQVLTVNDTRIAVEALEHYLSEKRLPSGLTDEQRALAQIYVDRLTVFGG